MKEAARIDGACIVPLALASYLYGEAAHDAGDLEAAEEALAVALALFPHGDRAALAELLLYQGAKPL